ncbi:MAG: hypothetical protein ACYDB9_02085 [Gammaproteobacteria bacterium]
MSASTVTIRYEGPILAGHQMDVADLAPALIGLSDLCKLANSKFNGDRAAIKVLIATDLEHKCFQFNLHIAQTIWDHTKAFLNNQNVSTAQDLLEWLGLTGFGGTLGLIRLVKWLKGRKITSTQMEIKDGRDVIRIVVDGDNNNVVIAHPQALELLREPDALASIKKVMQPLVKDGYDYVEFEESDKAVEKVSKEEAVGICGLTSELVEESEIDKPQTLTAWITVYSPVYDANAPNWRFKFGEAHEYMDISETDIAIQALRRGAAMADDAYYVTLEIRQEHKPNGLIKNHFKITKVLDFKPSTLPFQRDIFRDKPETDRRKEED